jgi:hypothetical protein
MLKVSIARPSSATITNANLYVKVGLPARIFVSKSGAVICQQKDLK